MGRSSCTEWHILCVVVLFCCQVSFLRAAPVNSSLPTCRTAGVPPVRHLATIPQDSYGRPGLAHQTLAGAVHHGMKEVEVWVQTFAPAAGTPIHRHDCEEVFVVLRGGGTLFLGGPYAPTRPGKGAGDGQVGDGEAGGGDEPGWPAAHPFCANSTFVVPPNQTHQITNTMADQDLQLLVVISRPPIRVYTYPAWYHPHSKAVLQFPYPWDRSCPSEAGSRLCSRL